MEPMVIEVLGVPLHDRMADQLKIHFLKRRNMGGDVLTVIYPTSTPGQAYVVFESTEVPGVLEFSHILDIESGLYPIHVKKAHISEVDVPVETMLDLSMFSDLDSVFKLLKDYDFMLTKYSPDHVCLKGSFLKLKLVRNELVQLRKRFPSKRPPGLCDGAALGYDRGRNSLDPKFDSESTSRKMGRRPIPESAPSLSPPSYRESTSDEPPMSLQNRPSPRTESLVDAYRQGPLTEGASSSSSSSFSENSPPSLGLVHHTSALNKEADLVGLPRSLHSSYSSSRGSTSHTVPYTDLPTQQQHVTGNETSVYRRSPVVLSTNSTPRSVLQDHTLYGSSSTGGSPRSRPSADSWAPLSSPSSSSGRLESFAVDTDIINFILKQNQDVVKRIEKEYNTEMILTDDNGCTMVKLSGTNCEKANLYLLDTIKEISPSLRTQEIHLKRYDHAKKKQILQRIQDFEDSGVLITQSNDVVKLVGPSIESFEVKQKILGEDDDPRRGRATEKSSYSRSSSVPRQYKPNAWARSTARENQAASSKSVQGHEGTSEKSSQRTCSHSEFRNKHSPTLEHQDVDPGQNKKSSKPTIINPLKGLENIQRKIKMSKK